MLTKPAIKRLIKSLRQPGEDGYIVVHFWDGKRYLLIRLPNGVKYDAATGKPISSKKR